MIEVPQPPAPTTVLSPRVIATSSLMLATLGLVTPYGLGEHTSTNALEWCLNGLALVVLVGLVVDLAALLRRPEHRRPGWAFMLACALWAADGVYLLLLPLIDIPDPINVGWLWAISHWLGAWAWALLAGLGWQLINYGRRPAVLAARAADRAAR